MPDKSWKALERRVASDFGGQRRGADTRGPTSGKSDVIHDTLSIEIKQRARPSWTDAKAAIDQAERNAEPGQVALAIIVPKHHDRQASGLVVLRYSTALSLYNALKGKDKS